jgi:hypothetical protein
VIKPYQVVLRLSNSRAVETTFVLEPWGETYPFGVDDEFVIVLRGPENGSPEVDFGDDAVTVWGWPGSTARLFRNEEELGKGLHERTPVPRVAVARD